MRVGKDWTARGVRFGQVETMGVDHTGEIWQSEGPQKRVEPQRPARLSEIKFTCLQGFTDINFTFFFFNWEEAFKEKNILLTERN